MTEPTTEEDLPSTPCRFSSQYPGFSIYIGIEIAEEVLKVLPMKKKLLAVWNAETGVLTIQKYKV